MTQQPSIGRIVHYTLSADDVKRIKQHRGGTAEHPVGNSVEAGQVYPMMIVNTWGNDSVNGQVFLDGPDTFWATSVSCGEGERHWAWPGRV